VRDKSIAIKEQDLDRAMKHIEIWKKYWKKVLGNKK
jgi:hypothetical protein